MKTASPILTLVALAAVAGCSGAPMAGPSVTAAGSGASLRLVGIEPASGAVVDEDTVMRATLHYRLPPTGDRYSVHAQFATHTPNTTTGLPHTGNRAGIPVSDREGEVSMEIPILRVLDHPEIARPIRMWLFLNRELSPNRSVVDAWEGPFRFEIAETEAETERPAEPEQPRTSG